jgi:sulfate/thiosulfate transport system permease protein
MHSIITLMIMQCLISFLYQNKKMNLALSLKTSKNVLPGFGLTLGFTVFYLSLIFLIPLSMIFIKTASLSFNEFWSIITDSRVLDSYKLSFGASFIAASINSVFGFLTAWVLVRYNFPGKKIIDSLVDLPFALPTAVAGISLTTVFAGNGMLGRYLEGIGVKAVFTPIGIIIALTFIGLPFVVRTIQPVLKDLRKEYEEAAFCLGASKFQTFIKVILPDLRPAIITGFTLAFARAVGEYGSVVFISGNIPFKTEIAPLLIMTKLEQYDYTGATAIAMVMLIVSFLILLTLNFLQLRNRSHK